MCLLFFPEDDVVVVDVDGPAAVFATAFADFVVVVVVVLGSAMDDVAAAPPLLYGSHARNAGPCT